MVPAPFSKSRSKSTTVRSLSRRPPVYRFHWAMAPAIPAWSSGTVTNINAALDGLTFTPTTDFRGEAIIAVEASDPNHDDANDDPLTAYGEVGIAVGGPVILVPDTQATNS